MYSLTQGLVTMSPITVSLCVTLANCFVVVSHCRDVALSITALSFNLWFTKLYCKDFRLVSAKSRGQDASEMLSLK